MGSEGPKAVTIHVTGFKKFQGVSENPTESIVNNLKDYVERRGLPVGVTLGSCTVLETAGIGAVPVLYKVIESGISGTDSADLDQVVWVSFFLCISFFFVPLVVLTELSEENDKETLKQENCSQIVKVTMQLYLME